MAAADKKRKAIEHANAAAEAAVAIAAALERGELPEFDDAKILEAAGSYVRKGLAKNQFGVTAEENEQIIDEVAGSLGFRRQR